MRAVSKIVVVLLAHICRAQSRRNIKISRKCNEKNVIKSITYYALLPYLFTYMYICTSTVAVSGRALEQALESWEETEAVIDLHFSPRPSSEQKHGNCREQLKSESLSCVADMKVKLFDMCGRMDKYSNLVDF